MKTGLTSFLLLFLTFCRLGADFSQYPGSLVPLKQSASAWGDFNNNGYWDLVMIGRDLSGDRRTVLYRNTGGELEVVTGHGIVNADTGAEHFGDLLWADINNSGRLDLIVAGDSEEGRGAWIYENTGAGFILIQEIEESVSSLAAGDYNNNGRLDLAVGTRVSAEEIILYRNTGDGFVRSGAEGFETPFSAQDLVWADLNNSGRLDLVACGQDRDDLPVTVVYENLDGVDFKEYLSGKAGALINEGFALGSIAAGDYNNNGMIDIALSGLVEISPDRPATVIYENSSSEGVISFSSATFALPGVYNSALAWGDFNNDGTLDLALSGIDGDVRGEDNIYLRVYYSTGPEPFDAYIDLMGEDRGLQRGSLAWASFQQAGRLDLIAAGLDDIPSPPTISGTPFTELYLGSVSPKPPPPAVSVDEMASVYYEGKLYIMWNPPAGIEDEFYYNFRVGEDEGGDNLVPARYGSPLMGSYLTKASTSTHGDEKIKNRQIPGIGGYRYVRVLEISGSNYHWAVQSINPSLGFNWTDASTGTWSGNKVFIDTTPPVGYPAPVSPDKNYTYDRDLLFMLSRNSSQDPETGIYGAYVQVQAVDYNETFPQEGNIVWEGEVWDLAGPGVWDGGGVFQFEYRGSYDKSYRVRAKARHGYTMNIPTTTYLTDIYFNEGLTEEEWNRDHRSPHYTSQGPYDGWSQWSSPLTPVELLSVRNNFITEPKVQHADIGVFAISSGRAIIRVFDSMGGHVATLFDEKLSAGERRIVEWNGVNSRGKAVASGIYYINIQLPDGEDTSKVAVIK